MSANQNCQNSLSYVVAVAKYCLAIARFIWIVLSSLFSSLVYTQAHARNVLHVDDAMFGMDNKSMVLAVQIDTR